MFSASKTAGPSGYNINNSLRFRSSATAYLSRTFSSTGTNNKIQTFSAWVKRGLLSSSANYRLMGGYNGSASYSTEINFVNDNLRVEFGGSVQYELKTTQVFRDPSAWYHIVVAIDTTQATSSNRVKMYVNGSQITAFATANYPAQNDGSQLTSANANNKLGASWSNAEPFDGYMAEVNFIDGQALTPSSFGSTNATTGVWQPKKYTGSYGTNGFYLPFSDIGLTSGSNTGLGKDFSGNSNYWTTNNISVTAGTTYDAMTDSPTNTSATVANYCVMNPLNKLSAATTSNGNLNVQTSGSSGATINGTFGVSSGKWYWETILNAATDATIFGIDEITELPSYPGVSSTSYSYYPVSALKINNAVQTSYGVTATTNDVIGCALDMDNGKIWWSKNGTWMASGDPVAGTNAAFTGITGTKTPAVGDGSSSSNVNVEYNFGQRPFAYTPPSGFNRLNTFNLPDSTIKKGNSYMDATAYTGTNGSPTTQVISSNFQPDFLWFKKRSAAYDHALIDTNRGITKQLYSNLTNAEGTDSDVLTAIGASSFTVGNSNYSNYGTLVAWTWKANGGTTSSNTSGSIASTVSVNTTAGFSIVTWTGNGTNGTIGHGLGIAPSVIFAKIRSTTDNWLCYHSALGATKYINLNLTNAATTNAGPWNNTAPTPSVFSVSSTSVWLNNNGSTYVAYCWAEIAGFSKFGSYTGNGSADGPFIFTGFRPKFVVIKVSSTTNSWEIFDTSRDTYNASGLRLFAESTSAEVDSRPYIDILSNGFKLRSTGTGINGSGSTYIFMAFAENPFKNALAR